MAHCCVISCLNRRKDKIHKFFTFPSDLDICTRWVDFCHCPETSERFITGGPYGLHNYAICAEHFDGRTLTAVDRKGQLPAGAVPVRIGKTHMTQEMLLEKGFTLETQDAAVDTVLVEMLSPEEMDMEHEDESNFEFVKVKHMNEEQLRIKFEDEIKQEPVEEEPPQTPLSAVKERVKAEDLSRNLDTVVPVVKKHEPCKDCASFKPRYKYELEKNNQLEEVIAHNKKRIATETIKLQKLHDRLTLKRMKYFELKKQLYELRKRWKKGVPVEELAERAAESRSSDDVDDADAWW